MYRNKEHGKTKTGALRSAPLFPLASLRLRAFAFPHLFGLCAVVVKKSHSKAQKAPKTFGHFQPSTKTPRHFQVSSRDPQNPTPFPSFPRKIFTATDHHALAVSSPFHLKRPKVKPVSLISAGFTTGYLH